MKAVTALVRRGVAFELALYRSLLRWVTRRPDVPAGTVAFAYVGAVAVLLWAFIVVSAIELVALHLLLPWETIRIIADVLGIWGLVWMLGLTASFNVYPHLVGDSGLRVRHGAATDITVPWDAIARISVRERSRDSSRALQLEQGEHGTVLHVVIASRTNVEITLRRPLVVPLAKGDESIDELRLFADDARALASRVREKLAPRRRTTQEAGAAAGSRCSGRDR